MGTLNDLIVYQRAFANAMDIFQTSKTFPVEEKYSLTDQIRRASRSVCINLAEGYRKRLYPAHFTAKLSDADMENSETQVWLQFAQACGYLDRTAFERIYAETEHVWRILNYMIENPEKFGTGR